MVKIDTHAGTNRSDSEDLILLYRCLVSCKITTSDWVATILLDVYLDNILLSIDMYHDTSPCQCTVRPHLSAPQISSSLTFHNYSFYQNKPAILLLYTILLLPHFICMQFHPERICAYKCMRSHCITK